MSNLNEQGTLDRRGSMTGDDPQEVWLMIEGLDGLDFQEASGSTRPLLRENCDWCGESSGSGYFVAVRDQNYQVCPICWGRSPAYIDSRRAGFSHEEACRMIGGSRGDETPRGSVSVA